MEDELQSVRAQLLAHRPEPLEHRHGAAALHQHVLLASKVHQAARLDASRAESETGGWIRYVSRYFPAPRNGDQDAKVLWTDWRTSLLKDGAPGAAVLVTHGQPLAHWQRDRTGRLCVDLESMWADFETSVESFMEFLGSADDRRRVVLERAVRSYIAVEVVHLSTVAVPASGWAGPPPESTLTRTISPLGASAVAWVPPSARDKD